MPRFPIAPPVFAALRCVVCAFVLTLFCGLHRGSFAQAQSPTESKMSDTGPHTFSDVFTQIAAQNHLVIVAEDVPLHSTLSQSAEQNFLEAESAGSLQKRIAKSAALFDYESQFIQPNVFVLRKKYTDPNDFPFVSWDEAARFLAVANELLSRFKSPYKQGFYQYDPTFLQAVNALTDEQVELMKQAKLPIASLSPFQKQQFYNALLSENIDLRPLDGVRYSQSDMNTIKNSSGSFRRDFPAPTGFMAFGFVYPTPQEQYFKNAALPLCYQEKQRRVLHGVQLFPFGANFADDGTRLPFVDATQPGEADRAAVKEQTAARTQTSVVTCKTLAERLTNAAQGKAVFTSETALADKPISLFGMENARAEIVFTACASVYDLRVVKDEPNGVLAFRLTMPPVVRPSNLRALNSALKRLVPGPYVRALHLPEQEARYAENRAKAAKKEQEETRRAPRRTEDSAAPKSASSLAEQEQQEAEKKASRALWDQWTLGQDTLERTALRRFRATVEPKVQAAPNKQLAFVALDETEKAALAAALMRFALQELKYFVIGTPPPYLERFNEAVLSCETRTWEGEQVIDFGCGMIKPNGEYDRMIGFTATRTPHKKP